MPLKITVHSGCPRNRTNNSICFRDTVPVTHGDCNFEVVPSFRRDLTWGASHLPVSPGAGHPESGMDRVADPLFERSRAMRHRASKPPQGELGRPTGPSRRGRLLQVRGCLLSTGGLVAISSADFGNRMPHAFELTFHETLHVESLALQVEEAFRAAGRGDAQTLLAGHDLFHAGAITRQIDYRHRGQFGVYRWGERWAAHLPFLRLPFPESTSADASARRAARQALAKGS